MQGPIMAIPQKLTTGILTIVQKYLPTNLAYTKFALINKKTRDALNTSGLRNGRVLTIHIPISFENIKLLSINKMLLFSDCIKIKIISKHLNSSQDSRLILRNLCDYIILELENIKINEGSIQTQFQLSLGGYENYCSLNFPKYWKLKKQASSLPIQEIKPFFKLIDYAKYFQSVTLRAMTLFNSQETNEDSKNITVDCISLLSEEKHTIKELKIIECDIIESNCLPKVYSTVDTLIYVNSNFIDMIEYGHYKNLKVLKVLNCATQSSIRQEIQQQSGIILQIFKGVEIEQICKLIYASQASPIQGQFISGLKVLDADVYFGNNLKFLAYNQLWQLITSIENCKLRDYDSEFSFRMIHNLLQNTVKIENVSSLPPIYLQIQRYRDLRPNVKVDPNKSEIEQILRHQAEDNGLIIVAYEEIFTKSGQTIYSMMIKLEGKGGRQLSLVKIGTIVFK